MSAAPSPSHFRPLPVDLWRPGTIRLAGGVRGFSEIEVLGSDGPREILPAEAARAVWPAAGPVIDCLAAPRPPIAGIGFDGPVVMGIVNVTPDSFSEDGRRADAAAVVHGLSLAAAGADLLDIGGESTRPGAEPVWPAEEQDRVLPVIEGLVARGCPVPISIDTRNSTTASAALAAGARIVNDISAMTHDAGMARVAAAADGVVLMHALGDPRTMQKNPVYCDVCRDIHDYLADRISAAKLAGIDHHRIIVDPGIGFGKTVSHNLTLIGGLSLFHGLGCPVLVGVSRKGFVGRLSGEREAARRAPGSIAAGLAALDQGAHILRVHDVAETVQAVRVWQALKGLRPDGETT